MKKTEKVSIWKVLSDGLTGFPCEDEKQEIIQGIDKIITYLEELKQRLKSLPGEGQKMEILSAISKIADFMETSKENPSLAAALGLQYKKARIIKGAGGEKISREEAEKLYHELEKMTTPELQERLLQYKRTPMDLLRGLASYLGIKNSDKLKREELVDSVVKIGFANIRGYDLLRSSRGEEK